MSMNRRRGDRRNRRLNRQRTEEISRPRVDVSPEDARSLIAAATQPTTEGTSNAKGKVGKRKAA